MRAFLQIIPFLVLLGIVIPTKIEPDPSLEKPACEQHGQGHIDCLDKSMNSNQRSDSVNTEDRNNIKSIPSGTNVIAGERNDVVAFSAQLSTSTEVSEGSPIMFDNIVINEGGRYVNTSGQFICLDDFVYVFMWSLKPTGSSSNRCLASLSQQGNEVKHGPRTSIHSPSSNYNGNSHMQVAAQCQSNPVAAFTVVSGINPGPTYSGVYSSFSGFRLGSLETAVGFTAELSQDAYLFPGYRIFFDNVISNFGGHFNSVHSYFRCPDDGVYSFTVSTHYPEGSEQWSVANLMFDKRVLLHGPITYRATADTDSGSSSISTLHVCEKDKDLYVETANAYTFPYSAYGARLTTFSGYQICSDDCADLVAFSVVLGYNMTSTAVDIPFEDVRVNLGDTYNSSTGTFTCPDNFLYLFMWSGTGSKSWIILNLYFDSVIAGRVCNTENLSGDHNGTSGTCSQSIIIRCSAGSVVTLRGAGINSLDFLLGDFSIFSGYRLPGQ